jgi:AraC-like DNA-binding protein
MFYILNGHGRISLGKEKHDLVPENLYLIPNYINCSYSCDKHLEMIYVIFINLFNKDTGINHYQSLSSQMKGEKIDKELFFRLLELNPERGLSNYDPKQYDNWNYLDYCFHLDKNETIRNFTESRGILLQLFSRFIISAKKDLDVEKKSLSTILKSILYINENLDEKLSVEFLSEQAFLSTDYYSRLFLKTVKCRPIEYIQRKRIEKAQLLLMTTNYPLKKITELTGLSSVSYLSRIFKRQTGMSPGKYKKSGLN